MCELFGFSSKNRYDAAEILRAFFSHADENPHGWGLADIQNRKPVVVKEAVSAIGSDLLQQTLDNGIRSNLLLGHIRYATKGSVSKENTHPFIRTDRFGTVWTLIHNGTIFDCDALSKYSRIQEGDTDSERILCYLTDMMDAEGSEPSADRKIQITEEVIRNIVHENKVNVMISDGERLYIHSNFRGSMHLLIRNGLVMAASRKLETASGDIIQDDWQEVPLNTLMVFRKGEQIYRGIAHSEEFFFDEEKMRMLFLDYAGM